jgi:transposase
VIVASNGVRVMVATRPVDFRKGMEGLAALVREAMSGVSIPFQFSPLVPK